jgi:leucyl-tRNA synthetase
MLKLFQSVYRAYAEHPFTKNHSVLDWGLCFGRIRNRCCYEFPCGDEREIMLLLISLRTSGMPEIKNILIIDIPEAAFGSKDGFKLVD